MPCCTVPAGLHPAFPGNPLPFPPGNQQTPQVQALLEAKKAYESDPVIGKEIEEYTRLHQEFQAKIQASAAGAAARVTSAAHVRLLAGKRRRNDIEYRIHKVIKIHYRGFLWNGTGISLGEISYICGFPAFGKPEMVCRCDGEEETISFPSSSQ